jgi:hypothetical protein
MTKINIAWAYFDSGLWKGFTSLEFINKYNKTFGDESTVVAVNLLNGMYSSNKGQDKFLFEKAIKFEIKEMRSLIYRILPGVF